MKQKSRVSRRGELYVKFTGEIHIFTFNFYLNNSFKRKERSILRKII